MDSGPLVSEEIEAGTRVLAELRKTMSLATAFWLKLPDKDSWNFYVAADRSQDDDHGSVGGEVLRVVLEMRDPNLGFLQVQTIPPDHPLARSALDYQDLYPGKAIRLRDGVFGGMGIEEVYIYPVPIAATSTAS
jgi:hypothetical protein